MMRTRMILALAPLVAATALGGDIDPPAGPVAPTMKTLDEVEPRIAVNAENMPGDATAAHVISAPGSYYLTGDVRPAGDLGAWRSLGDPVVHDRAEQRERDRDG